MNTLRSQKELTTKKSKLKSQVIDRISTLSTAAFGLIAALAWNDAIKGLFAEGGPLHAISTKGPWAYALIVTIIAAIVTIWIGKISEKSK
ncbi:MAG TPA: hypothetical protein ENN30_01025 [Candidatus Woesearchaeota archaeon]|nr:hypothetical protein [Candidatus Woesearchaeota archaeon]